jgi:hypothetical protein
MFTTLIVEFFSNSLKTCIRFTKVYDSCKRQIYSSKLNIVFVYLCICSSLLGINIPAKAERTVRRGDIETQLVGEPIEEFYDVQLTFGIIDILQDYDISKKLEHAYKSIQYDPTSISAVDPRQYSRRFRDFIFRIFTEEVTLEI